MNIYRQFFKDTTIYALEPILLKVITIFLIPLYTKYLSPSDYGNLQLLLTVGHFFRLVSGLGLVSSFWKFVSISENYNKKDVSLTLILTQIYIGFSILIIFIIIKFTFYSNNILSFLIILVLLYQIIALIFSTVLLFLREQLKSLKYLILTVLQNIIFVILNILFILILRKTYYFIIYSYLISYIISVIFSFRIFVSNIKGSYNFKLSLEMIKYGFPLMIGNLVYIIITMSDRFFLKVYSTDEALGLYSYGYKYADMINALFINVIFLAWNPIRWKVYEMKDGKKIFANFNKILHMIFIFFTLLLTSVILIFGLYLTKNSDYLNGFKILFIIAFSNVFYGLYYFNSMGLLFKNKTKIITYIISISAFLNIMMNFLLIPKFGMLGAAIATMLSYICLYILTLIISQKYYEILRNKKFEVIQFIMIIIFVFGLTFIIYRISDFYLISLLALMISLIYLFVNGILGFINRNQFIKFYKILKLK